MLKTLPNFLFLLLALTAGISAQQEISSGPRSIEQLAAELSGQDRELADAAKEELIKGGTKSIPILTSLVNNSDRIVRVRAINALGQIKDSRVSPLLIAILNDSDEWIVGTAAYSLSQIGGAEAKEAIFSLFEKCVIQKCENFGMIAEAMSELPDTRAVPSLVKIVEAKSDPLDRPVAFSYAVTALGKLGNKRAAVPIAKLLNPKINYSDSLDYLFLEAISKIKSRESVPYLIDYLVRLNERTRSHEWFLGDEKNDPSFISSMGAGNRQRTQDRSDFLFTISILESITGTKSIGKIPVEIYDFWIEQPR